MNSSQLYLCEICREAYFISREALLRHQQVCLAVKAIVFAAVPSPVGTTTDICTGRPTPDLQLPPLPLSKRTTLVDPPRLAESMPTTSTVDHHHHHSVSTKPTASRTSPLRRTSSKSSISAESTPECVSSSEKSCGRGLKRKQKTSPVQGAKRARIAPLQQPTAASATDNQAPALRWELKKGLSSAKDFIIRNPNMSLYRDSHGFLSAALPVVERLLRTELASTNSVKYHLVFEAFFNHPEGTSEQFNFKVPCKTLFGGVENLMELLQDDREKIIAEQDEFEAKGSGWTLDYPSKITLKVSRYSFNKLSGKAYTRQLPNALRKRKSTINVQNTDELCFKYSMLVKHLPNRPDCNTVLTENSFVDLDDIYNFDGVNYPVTLPEISKFERRNPGVSVNVFEVGEASEITPLRVVQEKDDHTDLLLYRDGSGAGHYVYIIDFARLIRPQIARGTHLITVCKRCVAYKETRKCLPDAKTWLQEHLRLCEKNSPTQISLPKEDENILKFEEYDQEIPVPIIVCTDFEATLVPIVGSDGRYQSHEPNSFCALVKSTLPESILREAGISTEPYVYRHSDAGRHFMKYMHDLAVKVEELYSRQEPLGPMTDQEKERHAQASQCDFCERLFDGDQCVKELDHDHITSKYRYTLCGRCNRRCGQPNFIPVYIHNLSNYDANFIIKNIGSMPGREVNVIPETNEKYISISVKVGRVWLRYLDSYRLMSSGLAKLASILSDDEFYESSKLVPPEHVELVKRKNVYPYDYVKSSEVFKETQLPSRESFYNRLNDEHCSQADYDFAQSVWDSLGFKTFGEYHDFYLKLDVCLLADCLTSFRKTCLEAYRIDCCHHYTAPGFSYKAMLRMTKVSLELITCSEQMLMVESGIRGGLVQCSLRHAKANNPLLTNKTDYIADDPHSYLLYLDCTNLYGKAMTKSLPTGNFKFIDDIDKVDWSNLPTDSPTGYILDCDIDCPDSVHDRLQDLPPLPSLDISPTGDGKTKKLLATLLPKKRYVVHYTALQQAVRLGLRVTKVHRVLSFSQSPFMKSFVELNARLRAETTNVFYKGVYKLITNSSFGRLILAKRKQREVRIVTTDRALQKLIRQPRFAEHVIISPNVVAVHMRKKRVKLDVPIFAGMTVLEHSKVHMYDFFYNVLCKELKSPDCSLDLCYLDTDGLVLYIRTERELYEILKRPSFARHLDQSVYPVGHPLRNDTNKGILGSFKDEADEGRQIQEFIGLRSKMYAYRYGSDEGDARGSYVLKAKGIKTSWLKSRLRFEDYKKTLFTVGHEPEKAEFNSIRSKLFSLVSTTVVKKSLSANDDKRGILDCGLRTLPHGHWRLREKEQASSTAAAADKDDVSSVEDGENAHREDGN